MNAVKINEKYYVSVDNKDLTLQKRNGSRKDGSPKYDTIGYYSNWESVFDKLFKIFIAEKVNGVIELKQLKKIIEDSRNEIKGLLKSYDNLKAVWEGERWGEAINLGF